MYVTLLVQKPGKNNNIFKNKEVITEFSEMGELLYLYMSKKLLANINAYQNHRMDSEMCSTEF